MKRVCSVAYRHLDKHKIEPVLYMMEWFMCAFSRTLPWASVLRVWDMFLCDGQTQTHTCPSFLSVLILSLILSLCRSENDILCGFGGVDVHAGYSG